MDQQVLPSFVESVFPDLPGKALHDLFVMEAEAHGFTLEDLSEGHYLIRTPVGFVEYFIEEAPVRLRLSSSDHKTLYYLKESIDADLMEADLVPEWAGNMPLSFRPPNFSTATVVSKTWINDVFMRVTLTGEDIERFFENGMHFRLIYPQKHGVKPVWPYLNEARRTVWPEGDEALMRPIYTVRTIDREARSFDFDIFMHEGGPTANWAQRVEEGCEIGLLGPAGGWMPKADHMLMAGDETAIPAIARILEHLPATTTGHVLLSLESEGGKVPISLPENMSLEWIIREKDDHDALVDATCAMQDRFIENSFVFFAAKKSASKKARAYFCKTLGYTTENTYIAGYWQ